jgi:hypothetical protein
MVDGLSAAIAGELEDWEETWKPGRRAYFIHYTGGRASSQFPISRIFFDYLTEPEREELMAAEEEMNSPASSAQTQNDRSGQNGKSHTRQSIKERPRDSPFLAVGKVPTMSSGDSFSL